MAYWKIDEGSGDFVEDSSLNGNHGTVENAIWTTDAKTGGAALEFNGQDSQVTVPDSPSLHPATGNITIGAWVKVFSNPKGWSNGGSIVHKQGAYQWVANTNGALWLGVWGSRLESIGSFDFEQHLNEWHHVATTYDNVAQHAWIYVDGELNIEGTVGAAIDQTGDDLYLGYKADGGGRFHGIIDEVRISDVVRSQDDIKASMLGSAGFPLARGPEPEDGTILEATWANLKWRPGDFAVSHDLYFGTDFDDINDGAEGTFAGNLAVTFQAVGFPGFPAPEGLQPGTTYYWRVDEVNDANAASPWKGEIWSFFVPPRTAYQPAPADGADFVPSDVTLTWKAGYDGKLHSVYFGDNPDEVANATGAVAQTDASFTPGELEMDKTYYWRVDEFDGSTTHTGDVWSFTTLPVISPAADPNLVAWWKFDEGMGDTALDWSGNGYHGILFGPTWTRPGALGEAAVNFSGSSRVAIRDLTYASSDNTEVAVSLWIRTSIWNEQYIASFDRDQYWRVGINLDGVGPGLVGWHVATNNGIIDLASTTRVDDGAWHHVCGVFDNGQIIIYIDGQPEASAASGSTFGTGNTRFGLLGANNEASTFNGDTGIGSPIAGDIDDMRIYDRALGQEEIVLVMRGDPKLAWAPSPADGSAPDIDNATPLSWTAGDEAVSHEVYFGTERDAVKNADTSDTTGVYRGSQNATSFTPAEGVEWGAGPFYWRVDENNADGTVTKGNVWSFTVADFLLVDDFESYTDNDAENQAIWQHWVDGFGVPTNGSQAGYTLPPYAEQTIVHGGSQSMPLQYNNAGGVRNSEAVLTLTAPRDWTAHGVEILSLWYRGFPPSDGSFVQGAGGTFTVTASGSDIWGTSDEFHFAYKTLSGPGSIVARVDRLENTHDWAKAGVMIRETLDPDSKYAYAVLSAASGVASQNRIDTAVDATGITEAGISAPHWVKLERDAAGFFTVSHSANGSSWNPVAGSIANNIPMASDVYIGLAVTSHNAAETCESNFSNVTMTGNVGAQWMNQDLGIESNAAEPFYVSVSNTNGTPAVVVNGDASAAVTVEWTEWRIDLSEFADQGVNLADVDKIAIGLGAAGDPVAAGGSGTMFIDDIVLRRPAANEQP
jgi:hypothetical protein